MDQNYNILENFEIVGVQVEGFEAFVGWLILVLIGFFTINLILLVPIFRSTWGIRILQIMFKLRNILVLILLSILVFKFGYALTYMIFKEVGITIFGFFREYFNNLN